MRINHPNLEDSEVTWLTQQAFAAAAAITVQANDSFAASQYVVIGKPGEERSEIRKVSTVTGNSLINFVGDVLKYDHPSNDPVTFIKYNQIKVFAATSQNGTYTQITGSPFAIDIENDFTNVINASETAGTWYKITYYNSTSALESDQSDPIPATGPDKNSVRKMIERVRKNTKIGPGDDVASDDEIVQMFNDFQDGIQERKDWRASEKEATLTIDGNGNYALPEDVLKIRRLTANVSNRNYFPRPVTIEDYDDWDYNPDVTAGQPTHYAIWGDTLYLRPKPSGINPTVTIRYFSSLTPITSDTQVPDLKNVGAYVSYANMLISAQRENFKAVAFWEKKNEEATNTLLSRGSASKQGAIMHRVRRSGDFTRTITERWPDQI